MLAHSLARALKINVWQRARDVWCKVCYWYSGCHISSHLKFCAQMQTINRTVHSQQPFGKMATTKWPKLYEKKKFFLFLVATKKARAIKKKRVATTVTQSQYQLVQIPRVRLSILHQFSWNRHKSKHKYFCTCTSKSTKAHRILDDSLSLLCSIPAVLTA